MKRPVMIQRPERVSNQSSRLGAAESPTTTSRRGREGPASAREESKSISFMYRQSSFDLPRNPFRSALYNFVAGALRCVAACSPKPVGVPPNLIVSSKPPPMPSATIATPNAPPRIVRIWFSTLTIRPGTWFDGTIVGSSNVASVEVRTAAFSINSEQVGAGRLSLSHARARAPAPFAPPLVRALHHRAKHARRSVRRRGPLTGRVTRFH